MSLQFTSQVHNRIKGTVLSATRIIVGALFACHGASTLFNLFVHSPYPVTFGAWPGWYAAAIELVAGVLVALGLFTRPAALVASGSMAYAYFTVHQLVGLLPIQNGGEPAVMFCWAFLLVAAFGAGPFALDTLIQRRRAVAEITNSLPVVTRIPEPAV